MHACAMMFTCWGELLGNTIRDQYGEAFFAKIERIRQGPRMTSTVPAGEELKAILDAFGRR